MNFFNLKAFYSLTLPQHQSSCELFLALGKGGAAYLTSLIFSLAVTHLNFSVSYEVLTLLFQADFSIISCNF